MQFRLTPTGGFPMVIPLMDTLTDFGVTVRQTSTSEGALDR
jgi:hypothetical protein